MNGPHGYQSITSIRKECYNKVYKEISYSFFHFQGGETIKKGGIILEGFIVFKLLVVLWIIALHTHDPDI